MRRNLSEAPAAPCDKLFVPPNLAVAINVAVHSVGSIFFAIQPMLIQDIATIS